MAAHEVRTIQAIYEDGLLKPLEPLALPEHTHVQLTVALVEGQFKTEDERIRAIFAAAGVELAPRPTDGRQPMSEPERTALGRRIRPGRPLSDIISEEREGI